MLYTVKMTIEDLRMVIDELRSIKANPEETLEEFKRQIFGVRSEKTSAVAPFGMLHGSL